MKHKKRVTISSAVMLLGLILLLIILPHLPQPKIGVPPELIVKTGYFQDGEGIKDANYKDIIISGQYKETVANKGYLLTADNAGELSLMKVSSRETIPIDVPTHAYQLKPIGEDFGFLQLRGDKQYITFLDPTTGKTSPVETSTNVISWDASGTDIAYHLYETSTLGFAEYDNNLGWVDNKELDAEITTLTQMFSKEGKNYVWGATTSLTTVIYSIDTHENVTAQFPILSKLEQHHGVLAAIKGDYWIVTAKTSDTDSSGGMTTQVWDSEGNSVFDLDNLGYELRGTIGIGNGNLYFPVSYTNGANADGLLIMNEKDHSTGYEEGLHAYTEDIP